MKRCSSCGQILAQRITTCPACGRRQAAGMTAVDDYDIKAVIHEGRSSLVFRAVKNGSTIPVTIRVFTDQSGVDNTVAKRLENELETLSRLPENLFVQHYAIRKSRQGLWYRISEWVDADNWGSIFVSGILNDQRRMATLFYNIASALECLHARDHFMPYLILDDILLPRDRTRSLSVKINYKLSRFLNARATHHGPMLNKLLACHPDITSNRAIDFRSAIWSLGKIYAELLTANPNLTDFSSGVDQIKNLDPELAVLVKVMLSDDPDLRPQTMGKVAQTLERILERLPSAPVHPSHQRQTPGRGARFIRQFIWYKRMVTLIIVALGTLTAAGIYFHLTRPSATVPGMDTGHIESRTRSVGFLMVEYWLTHDDKTLYKKKVEGTAFLVDRQGYLLTNRHVACPWLEDLTLFQIKSRLGDLDVRLDHRMFLWFEGTKAFNRFQEPGPDTDVADAYYLTGAYSSRGKGRLRVVGIPRQGRRYGERRNQPFKNDFAVLKIDHIPEGILPLPLATVKETTDLRRLSPVIIIGFPLGSQTQEEHVSASITQGHVRRTSRELIQVDSSIYKGNSGGPALNDQGRVIGIASGVITDQPAGPFPLQTPLSDFGLVLPIQGPSGFMESIKAGHPKWDGHLDFSLERKLAQVNSMAESGKFNAAAGIVSDLLEDSRDPAVLFTAAIMDFCIQDHDAAAKSLATLLSIEGENMASRLMLYIMDRLAGSAKYKDLTAPLFDLDWDDPDEFQGFLARTLKKAQLPPSDTNSRRIGYENPYEKAWCTLVDAVIMETHNLPEAAMAAYKEIALSAGANDQLYFMALARHLYLSGLKAVLQTDPESSFDLRRQLLDRALEKRKTAKEHYTAAVVLIQKIESPATSAEDAGAAFDELLTLSPDNRTILGRAAFFHARKATPKTGSQQALAYIDRYLAVPVRETALGLSLGLLKGQLLTLAQKDGEARRHLAAFKGRIQNAWYKMIVNQLLEGGNEKRIEKLTAGHPAKRLILHTALGLDAETDGNTDKAARHYREALGTYLDDWNEYDLVRSRLSTLKQKDTEE